ncbi:hypothetical protein QAD02_001268 [Eretmocerus hayati]|uniref:Uncharacterized protein n=1 Tax=Eretmocerus hayati TaxID=131215 RepID=A0ACC2NI69_9HYME|nr:hypothetical protein QAD02_001268 [Eretmocerus hayati]
MAEDPSSQRHWYTGKKKPKSTRNRQRQQNVIDSDTTVDDTCSDAVPSSNSSVSRETSDSTMTQESSNETSDQEALPNIQEQAQDLRALANQNGSGIEEMVDVQTMRGTPKSNALNFWVFKSVTL